MPPPAPYKGRARGHRFIRLHDPIFRATHWVFFGPAATAARAIKAVTAFDVGIAQHMAGRTLTLQTGEYVDATVTCVFKGEMVAEYLETLCHETHHAAAATLISRRVPLTRETVEVYAQYHEWLFREGRAGVGL